MPRDLLLASDRPVDFPEIVAAAHAIDATLQVRQTHGGGAVDISDGDRRIVTIVRSTRVENGLDVARFDVVEASKPLFLTEVYGALGSSLGDAVMTQLVRQMGARDDVVAN